ncbi:MAG TPA: ATP-binding protein [Streptosporangiaceae bacterium]
MLIPDIATPVAVLDLAPAGCGLTLTAWSLPQRTGVRHARRLLRAQVGPHIEDPAVLDDLDLMVSELGANAAVHTAGPFELRLVRHDDAPVACEIADAGGGLDVIAANLRQRRPVPVEITDIDALTVGGRGLGVVAHLSGGRCGVRTTHLCGTGRPGKGVWFAIPGGGSAEPARTDMPPLPVASSGTRRRSLREAVEVMFLDVKAGGELIVPGRF